jgi:hypothetical protein
MQARLNNPAQVIPEAMPAIMALTEAVQRGGVPAKTLELTHLRPARSTALSDADQPQLLMRWWRPAPNATGIKSDPGLAGSRRPGLGTPAALQREVRVPKPTGQGHLAGFGEVNRPDLGCSPPRFER